jgi:hypothetical protein
MQESNQIEQNPPVSNDTAFQHKITNVLVEINNNLVPIKDLPQFEYEAFLEGMHHLRLAYISIKNRSSCR